ncbi:MAG: pyrimidine dimer DNA glycosylase/endonuclease V [Candidatus Omnitrophica bacterium]|nr:pyrimidine dimer DNA glycosylase/endonuclease V [Candidatus Omnitrophota bacterium]
MRIWDIPPEKLCRNHLLGEHRELHAIWNILTLGNKGYCRHPETLRWKGKLKALFLRHRKLVNEMKARGYCHYSDLPAGLAKGKKNQDKFVDSVEEQLRILKNKRCNCVIS